MVTSKDIVVWTAGNQRIWWACPSCKVEAGVTLPVALSEIARRMDAFRQEHLECNDSAKEVKAWRG